VVDDIGLKVVDLDINIAVETYMAPLDDHHPDIIRPSQRCSPRRHRNGLPRRLLLIPLQRVAQLDRLA
jgi:hypothetical protein